MRRAVCNSLIIVLALGGVPPRQAHGQDSIQYVTTVVSTNRVGMRLSNYGVLGNNFTNRSPSLEYPLGTGYEHLTTGGLWIGAQAHDADGPFTGVTTGSLDWSPGSSVQQLTEFTPAGNQIHRRSRLSSSQYYDPAAVSDLDFLGSFSDRPARRASNNSETNRPLNVLVNSYTYSWASDGLQDFLVLRFVITNLGLFPLTNVWAGLWTELASGPKNEYSTWPPSSSGGPGSWFSKKWLQYDAAQRLIREHYCAAQPVPGGCNLGFVPAWMGVELLGTRPDGIAGKQITLAAWDWSPQNPLRDQDTERYAIMSAGTIQNLNAPDLMPQTGDPVELLAAGPFPVIAPGDSVTLDLAIVGGTEVADIQANAARAQLFYDSGFDIVTPVNPSLVHAIADPGAVRLRWYSEQTWNQLSIERRDERSDWRVLADPNADGNGWIDYQDRDVIPGGRYGYRLLADGEAFGEAWVDVPVRSGFRLEGVRPNPASRGLTVSFSLPDDAAARFEVTDVAGRRVITREVGPLGAGPHEVDLAENRSLAAGVYLVRLIRNGQTLTTRALVVK